jgi:uncharacterized protein DUF5565
VTEGEGVATIKWDGTSCLVRDSALYRRYDAKGGKTPPPLFEPAQEAPDPVTRHWPGWLPVGDAPADKWHRAAWAYYSDIQHILKPGTYELVGPGVQGNPYDLAENRLYRHGSDELPDAPRTFAGLRAYFEANPAYEGIVWHHPDGRMVKAKRKDMGLAWPG